MLRGLAFDSLPAHVIGTGTDSTGRTVDLQRLGNTLAGREENVIVENGVPRPADSRPAGYIGPWIEPASTPAASTPTTGGQDITDPFVVLDQIHQARMSAGKPLFESQAAQINGELQQQYALEKKQYDVEMSYAKDDAAKQQIAKRYAVRKAKIQGQLEPAQQELTAKQQTWEAKISADREKQATKLQLLQALGQKYGWDPKDVLREQYQTLGVPVPQSLLGEDGGSTPVQRLNTLRPIYSELLKQSAQYRNTPTGWKVFDADAKERYPHNPEQWYKTKATPEQAAEAEDVYGQLSDVGEQLQELRTVVGRRPTLVDDAGASSPIGDAVKAAKLGETALAVSRRHWPLAGGTSEKTRVVGGRTFKQVGPDKWVPAE